MINFLLKACCLAFMVVAIMAFFFPAQTTASLSVDLPWSSITVRTVAFLALLVSFAIFSGPSKLELALYETPANTSLQKLAAAIDNSERDLLEGVSTGDRAQILGHVQAGNKVAAIKLIRASSSCGLREAKEMAEELQATLAGAGAGSMKRA